MKTRRSLALGGLLAAFAVMVAGCAYMNVQWPAGSNFVNTQLGAKEGRSNAYCVLWLVAWGNAGTRAAASHGGIKVIRYADTKTTSVLLGAYSHVTTIVYGD